MNFNYLRQKLLLYKPYIFTANRVVKTLTLLTILLTFQMHSQSEQDKKQELKRILKSGKTFNEIVKDGQAYFKRKHPNLTSKQLTNGVYRDGDFVKFERWKYFWSRHLTPEGKLGDISRTTKNKKFQKSNTSSKLSGFASSPYNQEPWVNINYTNHIGGQISMGRTTCVAFHPTDALTFYVGAANGGIWKTSDGGQNYIPLGDQLPLLSVSTIVVNANNPNIIYIGVSDHVWYGHPGLGVFKSVDGGLTWQSTTLSFNINELEQVTEITADPTNPNTMLVATTKGTYKTIDGFNTITQTNNYSSSTSQKIIYAPGSSSIAYLCTDSGDFYKSFDGGSSWTLKKSFGSGNPTLTVSDLDSQIVFVSHGGKIYKSFNQGESFMKKNEKSLPENGHAIISPNNTETLLSGNFEFWRSNNGGATHSQIADWLGENGLYEMHVDVRNILVNPLENNKVYICHDGGVDRLNLDNNSFENLSGNLIITQFYDIATAQSNPIVVSGGSQDNGSVFKNTSGTWQYFSSTGDGMVTEIDPTNENIMYFEYQHGNILRREGGSNYSIVPPNESDNGAWVTPYELDKTNPNRLIIGYNNVYESTNKGNSWTIIGSNISSSDLTQIAISKTNPQKIYASQGNTVYERIPGTTNWNSHTGPSNTITDLKVDPTNENTIYITIGGYSAGNKVFKSIDGGANWINISGSLPNVPVNAIQTYETVTGGLFIGTYSGVYYKDDNSTDWFEYGQLPHTDVQDIEINYSAQKVRIGTHGRGMFEADINISVCDANSPDSDNDGICDLLDSCPNMNNNLIGTPCDDGDPETINEVYMNDCSCGGGSYITPTYCTAVGSAGTGADYITRVQLNTIDNISEKTSYSDFRNQITDLEIGQTYNITIALATAFASDVALAWIDFNADGTFDNTTELITFSAFNNNVATAQVTIPQGAQIGITGFRARNIYGTSIDPCGSYYGEVEDYAIRINSPTNDTEAPTPPTNLIASNITDTTATLTWTASTDNVGVTAYEVFEGGTISVGTVTETSMNLTGLSENTSYSYTVKAQDASGNVSGDSNTETFITNNTPQGYCAAAGTGNTGNHYIRRVQINTIDNVTTSSSYSDYTNISTQLSTGATYTISITLKQASGQDNAMAWIDYNNNLIFEANELINFSNYQTKVANATFTVPSSAAIGNTRLRVRNIYTSSTVDPCGNYPGEVEDYMVSINSLPSSPQFNSFVYPNPTSGQLKVKSSDYLGDYTLKVYNIYGNLILEEENIKRIDTSLFPNGLYFIEIYYVKTRVLLTEKVLVNH